MTRDEVLAFLGRDWGLARRVKDEAMGAFVRKRGATAAFRLAQAMLDQSWRRVRARPSEMGGLLEYSEIFERARAKHR
jgi:hypothetical protein